MNNSSDNDIPSTASRSRDSLLPSFRRWVTNLYSNPPDEEPPVDDPSNAPEVNALFRREYHTLRNLNQTLQTVISSFEQTRSNIEQFTRTVDQTDQLLDLWTNILLQSENIKERLDDPSYKAGSSLPPSLPQQEEQQAPQQPSATETQHEAPPAKRLKRSTSSSRISRRH
ncbi:hypothetical protein BJV82DRAFT_655489 [Fennellomyces sp. T-0311]|nr:hypothetical protein BJV82DRAFT_655489 [Fennellomyces sp. T-0311]